MQNLSTLLPLLQRDFFMRIVLASVEVIRLLHTQDSILHESFGIGAGGDCSSGADLLAEAIFCKFLVPHYHVDSEESGFIQGCDGAKGIVVLDPLDGSSNFKSNIPYYGASLALCDENGRVREACVVNYISHEIAYLNDDLLPLRTTPCVFSLQAFIADLWLAPSMRVHGVQFAVQQVQQCYAPCDFIALLKHSSTSNKEVFVANACQQIQAKAANLPTFDSGLLEAMFASRLLMYRDKQANVNRFECGIFEKAGRHHEWVEFLAKHDLKFRSLGAIALSLAFSFRYLFVLLPTQVRKYDGMAGFYLAQNQMLYGNVQYYCKAIPSLMQCEGGVSYIVIATHSAVIDKFIGR